MTSRGKQTYSEREREAINEFAMKVYLSPDSTDEDREGAKQRLVGTDSANTIDPAKLTTAELRELLRLIAKSKGLDAAGNPWTSANKRERAQQAYEELKRDLESARERLAAVWPEYFAPKALSLSLHEQLENAMAFAQECWDKLAAECRARGDREPQPFYAFAPTAIVPTAQAERGELAERRERDTDRTR